MAEETRIIKIEVDAGPVEKAAISIKSLTDANKKLREERKNLDITTAEGQKQIELINKSLDRNNQLIKDNSSTIEKNRMNVGNYTESIKAAAPALDKMTGGLYSAAQGAAGMTKSALAFIATPIGAVIGALGLALGALTAYFKGSEEGQDKLAKVMAIGKVVFEGFMVVVEKIGEVVFAVGEAIFTAGGKLLDFFSSNAKGAVDSVVDAAAKISDLEDKIDADENAFIVKRAATNAKVQALREKAIKLEGEQKRKVIQEAIDLEKSLAAEEAAHAQERLDLIDLNIQASGAATEEQKKQRAEALADVINKQAEGASATIKFQKELEKINDEAAKKESAANKVRLDALAVQEAQAQADRHAMSKELDLSLNTELKDRKETEVKLHTDAATAMQGLALHTSEIVKAADKSMADSAEAESERRKEAWVKGLSEGVKIADDTLGQVNEALQGKYQVQENQLAVTLSKQKTLLQTQYAEDVKLLEEKFNLGVISKEEYDNQILGLNQKYQADVKAAEIEQATALNEIKRKEFEANKKNQIAQVLADIAQAIIGVFAGTPGGPIVRGIAAAAAAVFGGIQIAQIKNTEFVPTTFFEGGKFGYTGAGNPHDVSNALGSKPYTYHKDEYIVPSRVLNSSLGSSYVDRLEAMRTGRTSFEDGGLFANQATQSVDSQIAIVNALKNMPNPVLGLREFNRFQNEIALKESIVTA